MPLFIYPLKSAFLSLYVCYMWSQVTIIEEQDTENPPQHSNTEKHTAKLNQDKMKTNWYLKQTEHILQTMSLYSLRDLLMKKNHGKSRFQNVERSHFAYL